MNNLCETAEEPEYHCEMLGAVHGADATVRYVHLI